MTHNTLEPVAQASVVSQLSISDKIIDFCLVVNVYVPT